MAKTTKFQLSKTVREITFSHRNRVQIYLELPEQEKGDVILLLSRRVQRDLANKLSDEDLLKTLEYLDPVDATHIIQNLPKKRANSIIEKLSESLKESVELLVKFDPQTAAGLMSTDYIQVDFNDSVKDVAVKFKKFEEQTGRLPVIVILKEGRLVGYLPGHQFGFGKPNDHVSEYMRQIPKVGQGKSVRDVLNVFRKHKHDKVVVTGEDGNVLGIIYSDDVIRLLREEESASLYEFAGVRNEEDVGDPTLAKVRFRYKWLIINLGTAFLAASIVSLFQSTISKYVLLAVYMPIVAGMGGNAATQTLAVQVRGIALKQISLGTAWPALKRELGAAFINGLINGILVALIVIVIDQDVKIALILAVAMIFNLLVAAFFGTMVPLIMKKLGKDPAASATIFITTATDVLGFLAFLGLATLLLT